MPSGSAAELVIEVGGLIEIETVVGVVDIVGFIDIVDVVFDSISAVSHTVDAPVVVALTDTPPAH